MNLLDKIKTVICSKKIAELENKVLELQSANSELSKERDNLKVRVSSLESKLNFSLTDLEKYNTHLRQQVSDQEYLIHKVRVLYENFTSILKEDDKYN